MLVDKLLAIVGEELLPLYSSDDEATEAIDNDLGCEAQTFDMRIAGDRQHAEGTLFSGRSIDINLKNYRPSGTLRDEVNISYKTNLNCHQRNNPEDEDNNETINPSIHSPLVS